MKLALTGTCWLSVAYVYLGCFLAEIPLAAMCQTAFSHLLHWLKALEEPSEWLLAFPTASWLGIHAQGELTYSDRQRCPCKDKTIQWGRKNQWKDARLDI